MTILLMKELFSMVRTELENGVGFVVVKFSFLKQFSLIFGNQNIIHNKGYSAEIGILLVVLDL